MAATHFLVRINTDNQAFQGNQGYEEIVRILKEIATNIERRAEYQGSIFDSNGNSVGSYGLTQRTRRTHRIVP